MRNVICAALLLCSVASADDADWRARFDKYREKFGNAMRWEAYEWDKKAEQADAEAKAAAKKGKSDEAKRLTATAKSCRAERDAANKLAKESDAKSWKPTKTALRTIEKGEFCYAVDAPFKVIQVLDGGAIITRGSDTFFVRGLGDVVDGRTYAVNGYIECTGTYKHGTRTVAALQLHGK